MLVLTRDPHQGVVGDRLALEDGFVEEVAGVATAASVQRRAGFEFLGRGLGDERVAGLQPFVVVRVALAGVTLAADFGADVLGRTQIFIADV